jgi:hypothetical protein
MINMLDARIKAESYNGPMTQDNLGTARLASEKAAGRHACTRRSRPCAKNLPPSMPVPSLPLDPRPDLSGGIRRRGSRIGRRFAGPPPRRRPGPSSQELTTATASISIVKSGPARRVTPTVVPSTAMAPTEVPQASWHDPGRRWLAARHHDALATPGWFGYTQGDSVCQSVKA